ncbi:PAS domain S-box-containing protein/diguanylate cyclase (GGDEF) domain-containing protein [Pseudomonas linyingensis]|uniref:cyclic-guanylate-specific phosphodiesterase n=1 Tax=Pseudomonas linyingensis TaxID=915471 RepID=A0A1H6ZI52_9PSED|nr:EAL domain-containing protein [Pseudomonas linyingensis]SEJ49240.1 PAS domain S-box-containing protein/diguanylate cyclase (GGDEF) domain-containing protein [Pseudomonas linyingensis]
MSIYHSPLCIRSNPQRFSLQWKFAIILIVLAMMAAGNVVIVHNFLARLSGVAEVVNLAGKLRMLSQKIAFEELASWYQVRSSDSLTSAQAAYESALNVLKYGGDALGLSIQRLPPAMQPLVFALHNDWQKYRNSPALENTQGMAAAMPIERISSKTDLLLASAETLVSAITLEAQRTNASIQKQVISLFISELVIFLLLVWFVRWRVLEPLHELTRRHRELAHGNYSTRMRVRSGDEISELASAFNFASQTIADLMHQNQLDNTALQHSSSMFKGLAENSIAGVYIAQNGRFLFANQRMAEMFGYNRERFTESINLLDLINEEDLEIAQEQISKRLSGEASTAIYEVRGRKSNGALVNLEIYGSAMAINGCPAVIGVMLDVTERHDKQRQQQLEYIERLQYQATHDELTGLANRKLFLERLDLATIRTQRTGAMAAVLLLDLNKFKVINDSLGHHAGDELLRAVGRRLQKLIRGTDTVARLGGDEFVVLLSDLATPEEAAHVAQRIIRALTTVVNIETREVHVGASIGISLYPQDGQGQDLLKSADLAMYQAKREEGNAYKYYSADMDSKNRRHMELLDELHHALNHKEMTLVYQPQLELESGRIVGAEALLRWQHPRLGNISPAEFIPLAEETGLINQIGEWVIHTACAQNATWHRAGLSELTISVNLSARQLRGGDLSAMIGRILENTGLSGQYLDIELTESVLAHDLEEVVEILSGIRKIGVGLSLDDFGTGYSSLGYLMRLPFDNLKLDRSFTSDLDKRPNARTLTQAIITLAHNIGLRVVAEGIETAEQLEFLRSSGCDQGQGYFFSPAVSADAFFDLINEGLPRSALQRPSCPEGAVTNL